ncbi:hypothetical protein KCU98_g1484, partial [Aureobasidium melanogenum]
MPIGRPNAVFIPKARADKGAPSATSIPKGLRNPTLKVWKCFDLSPDHLMRQCEKCKTGYRYETNHGATEHLRSKHSNMFGKDMMELSKGKNRRWVLSTKRLIEEGWLRDVSVQDVSEPSPQQGEQLLTVIRTTKPFAGGSQNSTSDGGSQRPHLHQVYCPPDIPQHTPQKDVCKDDHPPNTDSKAQRLLPEYRERHTTAAEPDRSRFPDLQNPVISIVSSVVDDFEIRLRDLIRSSTDLNDLEGRVPMIRGQFLVQYGIRANQVERDHPPLPSLRTVSSSPTSERLSITTPPDVADLDRPHLEGATDHDERTLSSNSQPNLNNSSSGNSAQQDTPHDDPPLIVSSDLVWLQNEFADFDNDMLSWDPNDETWNLGQVTTNDLSNSLYTTESSKDVHAYDALIQPSHMPDETIGFSR